MTYDREHTLHFDITDTRKATMLVRFPPLSFTTRLWVEYAMAERDADYLLPIVRSDSEIRGMAEGVVLTEQIIYYPAKGVNGPAILIDYYA